MNPKLSIICPAYNHEKFIRDFIESFINQTEKDIELIIIDDFSTDTTREIIKSYKDSRIITIFNDYNMGINSTIKKGILYSNADIFAICASDDILFPNYASTVIEVFEKDKSIASFYTTLEKVDINGNRLNEKFESPYNLTKFQTLEKLFIGNFMPAPGSAFKKNIALSLDIPAGLFQLQDYYFNVQILLKADTYFHKEPLVYYRITNESVSINSKTDTGKRINIEQNFILDLYYNIKDVKLFMDIFPKKDLYEKIGIPTCDTIPFFVCLFAIQLYDNHNSVWGYKNLIKFYSDKDNQTLLYELYGIQFKDIIKQAKFITTQDDKCAIKISKIRKKRKILSVVTTISIVINILLIIYIAVK